MNWFIQTTGSPVCVTDGIYKWPVPSGAVKKELESKGLVKPGVISVSSDVFNRIKMTHSATGGDGTGCRFNLPMKIVEN